MIACSSGGLKTTLLSSTKLQLGYECAAERRTQSSVRAPWCAVARPCFLLEPSLERRGFFYGFRSKRIESAIGAFHDAAPSKNANRESHAARGLSTARYGRRHRAFKP